jgi:predicted PurR-regulated permease PerM
MRPSFFNIIIVILVALFSVALVFVITASIYKVADSIEKLEPYLKKISSKIDNIEPQLKDLNKEVSVVSDKVDDSLILN